MLKTNSIFQARSTTNTTTTTSTKYPMTTTMLTESEPGRESRQPYTLPRQQARLCPPVAAFLDARTVGKNFATWLGISRMFIAPLKLLVSFVARSALPEISWERIWLKSAISGFFQLDEAENASFAKCILSSLDNEDEVIEVFLLSLLRKLKSSS